MSRRRSLLHGLIAIAASTLLLAAPAKKPAAPDAHSVLDKVDRYYNRLHSLRVAFSESFEGAGVHREESGVLILKKPGRMRWEYDLPRPKLFLADGKTAYFYVPGENQARRAPVKQLDDLQSPLRFLLGRSQLAKELEGAEMVPLAMPDAPGAFVIRGRPKHLADRVESVTMEIDSSSRITGLIIEEVDGNRTTFRFHHFEDDPKVSDDLFRFHPPQGVELVEGMFQP